MDKKKLIAISMIIVLFSFDVYAQKSSIDKIVSESGLKLQTLTNRPYKVQGIVNPMISLNGNWHIAIEESEKAPIRVPGELIMQGQSLNIGETAHYYKDLVIPKDWKNKRVFIRFDAVSSYAKVFINGNKVVEHEGSYVPFDAEITEYLDDDGNTLQVDVQVNTISDILACTSQYAAHNVAGILRKVTLFALPNTYISDIKVNTTFDDKYKNGKLNIDTKLDIDDAQINNLELKISFYDSKKKLIEKSYTVKGKQMQMSLFVKKPKQWNPEHPFLYELETELLKSGVAIQKNRRKIGFRQVEIKGGSVHINGNPIKLHGVNRHVVHPLTGRSISPELARKDVEIFKKANCNFIRTSHYPPSEEFLDAADELGIFVECEASLTWIGHHAAPIWRHWDYKDKRFLPNLLIANIDNVNANRHHPSIIIWSLANESYWNPLWEKVNKVVKSLDPTRPTAFHDQAWGNFNNKGSTADISNIHYTDYNGPSYIDKNIDRPVLIGEYAHLPTYNRRELLTDPGVRDAYNQPLVQFYDSIYHHKNTLGGAIWSGIDDTFHLPNGKIVGYGPWGFIDGWRREKPEYYGVKKAYSPIRITKMRKTKEQIILNVENRYDFTPLSKIKIETHINEEKKYLKNKTLPRKSGIIKIPYKGNIESLRIAFYDHNGNKVEDEYFNYKKKSKPINNKKVEFSYIENKDSYLIKQGEISYRINKYFGNIEVVKNKSTTILNSGPRFTLVESNRDYGGKENIAGETYQRVIHPIQNFPYYIVYAKDLVIKNNENGIEINMNVTFKQGNGTMKYTFLSNGQFITEYDIQKTDNDASPYQYGLVMQLPKDFDKLTWKRNGDFTIYPNNHIGRLSGTAKLNASKTNGVEMWRKKPDKEWKDDSNEFGSNDFKSSKRNIINASLENGKGTKVEVISNGKQTSRVWLQEEQINWLIADYSNNGSEPFYGAPHSNGRIKTKGKRLKGKLVLSFN